MNLVFAQLRIAQPGNRIVLIEPLLGLGGGLDVPLKQRPVQRFGHLDGKHRLTRSRLALDEQWPFQGNGGVDRHFQIVAGDVIIGSREFHECEHPPEFGYRHYTVRAVCTRLGRL